MASAKKAASATKATVKGGKAGASKPAKTSNAAKAPARSAAASTKSTVKKGAAAKPAAAAPKKSPAAVKSSAKAAKSAPSSAKPSRAVTAAPSRSTPAAAKAPAKSPAKPSTSSAPKKAAAKAVDVAKKAAPGGFTLPPPKGVTKDGITYTKDFDVKFLASQKALLLEERAALVGQATLLEDEANSIIAEQEMGDVQFDDEGGEGDTMVVERERDLALSAQARQTVADIDAALERLAVGTYGYSTQSGRPIPRERLEAIPWAVVLVEEKVGGIGRR
jgi:RNA polymerase-binding transcription factor DksA